MAIKVFVGCAANGEDAESQAVLEYTLRNNSFEEIAITWMRLTRDPLSPFYCDPPNGWRAENWATPFSGFRWAIPSICNYQGRAIYMDSDFIIQGDIAELWDMPLAAGKVMAARGRGRYCCILWDCQAAKAHIPAWQALQRDSSSHARMTKYFQSHPQLVQEFPNTAQWNFLDIGPEPADFSKSNIKAIHYTRMEMQPQLRHAVPRLTNAGLRHWYHRKVIRHSWPSLEHLFDDLYEEAKKAGYTVDQYVGNGFGPYPIRTSQ